MLIIALALANFAVPFGKGPAQVGLIREEESSPEAPGSIAVDADGRFYILDAVDQRVAVFRKDGGLDASIPLPTDTIEDIALLPSGDIAVLDRLVDRTVSVIAPNGAVLTRAAVEGRGVDDGGEVTALFADATGVYVEVLRGEQVRVIDGAGKVDDVRPTRPGVPFGDRFVRLRKVGDGCQILFFDGHGTLVADNAIMFESLLELSGLAVRGDQIYVAGHELVENVAARKRVERDRVVVVELERKNGRINELSRHVTKASPEWVPLKQLALTPTGVAHLYVNSLARSGEAGMEVTSW